jgi:hypothetical protein
MAKVTAAILAKNPATLFVPLDIAARKNKYSRNQPPSGKRLASLRASRDPAAADRPARRSPL